MSAYKTVLSAKLHGIEVTLTDLGYDGSCAVPVELMEEYGIDPYEQMHIYNMTNGMRIITYAIPNTDIGVHMLGAAARCAEVGDKVILATYRSIPENEKASPKKKVW